jgi:hypothetical protein
MYSAEAELKIAGSTPSAARVSFETLAAKFEPIIDRNRAIAHV